ncbi:hypothetical protein BP5796_09304 [Coleophoma crateriformis]|uniref:Uncharacterized protein n=1 Tax=Coleophoma crateriformis TaxID=565419 RepID=A0A3D8R3P1_9HELO|nr:hypothetical protein BP5796_09304 [Coleophoma crateriformis]
MPSDLRPVVVLQEALENVSLGDVLQLPAALQSFHKFLRRGTSQQREQLLHSSSHDLCANHPATALAFDDGNTTWPSNPPKIGQKRLLSSQHYSTRNASARKRKVVIPPHAAACSFSATTSHQSSLATIPFREADRGAKHSEPLLAEEDESAYKSILETVKVPLDTTSHGLSSQPNLLVRAREFFEARLNSRKNRAPYLVRAVQGFLEAPLLPAEFSKDMWNEKSAIFSKPQVAGSTARFRSLYEGHRKIKRCGEQYLSATRFCYIYLEHDLEQIMASQELVLSQGRGKVTAAFQLQAESISITMDTLRAERKAGRGYIRLLMEGGPGFVLRMGSNVSTIWERKLSMSDIALIIEFIKTHAVDLYDEIKSYDKAAVQGLLDGFIAYGWTRREIRETKSSLFDELQRYVDVEDTGLDVTCDEPADITSLPIPTLEPSQYTMSGETLASPVFSDLDLLLEGGDHTIPTPTNSTEVPEPVIIDHDSGYVEMTDLKIDQFLSDANYDIALDSMQCSDSTIQDDFNLFQELFPELAEHQAGSQTIGEDSVRMVI